LVGTGKKIEVETFKRTATTYTFQNCKIRMLIVREIDILISLFLL